MTTPEPPSVFYLTLPNKTPGVRCFWEPDHPPEPAPQRMDVQTWLKQNSAYQQGQALPPRRCPECGGVGDSTEPPGFRPRCVCTYGQQHFTAGPLTLVKVSDILEHLIETANIESESSLSFDYWLANLDPPTDYLIQTIPARGDKALPAEGGK